MKAGEAIVEYGVDTSRLAGQLAAANASVTASARAVQQSVSEMFDAHFEKIGLKTKQVSDRANSGILESLKTRFGRGSDFKEGFEVLLGGGAIAGLGLAARAFKGVADSVADLSVRFREGELTGGEFVGELARSIPVVGTLARAFDALWDATMPGESAAGLEAFAKRQNEIMNRTQEGIDREIAARRRLRDAVIENSREVHRVIGDPNRRIGIAGENAFERGILEQEASRRAADVRGIAELEREVEKKAEREARRRFEEDEQARRFADLEDVNERIGELRGRGPSRVRAASRVFSGGEGADFASATRGKEFGELTQVENRQLAELQKIRDVLIAGIERNGGAVFQ